MRRAADKEKRQFINNPCLLSDLALGGWFSINKVVTKFGDPFI